MGLFAAHKLVFSFLIATSIERHANRISLKLWTTFINGPETVESKDLFKNPDENVLSP